MLQSLRKGASTWVVRIFIGILAVSFGIGIWQGNTLFSGRSTHPVATVGKTEVSPESFQAAFNRRLRQVQAQYGGGMTRDMMIQAGLHLDVLNQLTAEATIREAGRQFGLAVPDTLIINEIQAIPAFRDAAGRFDPDRFRQVLQQAGLTEAMVTEQLRATLLSRQLLNPVIEGSQPPRLAAESLYRYRDEKRSIAMFDLGPLALGTVAAPTEDEITAYYEANPKAFSAPEYRKVTVLDGDPDAVAKGLTVAPEELQAAYDDRLASLQTPETRDVQQFVLGDEATATKAAAELAAGADFAAVAKTYAKLEAGDIELGFVPKPALPAALGEAVFALPEGGTTAAPVKTNLGWHLARVTGIKAATTKTLDDVKDELTADIARQHAEDKMVELGQQLQDALAGGASLENAGSQLGLTVTTIEALDRSGRDPSGTPVANLPKAANFLGDAFTAEVGVTGNLSDGDKGGFYVLRVDAVTPAAVKPLATVRDQVIAAALDDRSRTALRALADTLVARINGGEAIAAVAKSVKAKLVTLGPGVREGDAAFAEKLPADLVTALFATAKGTAVAGAVDDKGDIPIAVVTAVEAADPAAAASAVDDLRKELATQQGGELAAATLLDLRTRYGYRTDQAAIDKLLGAGEPGTP